MAFVSYKVVQYTERYTCPNCGTKRVHHRSFIRVEEKDQNVAYSRPNGQGNPAIRISGIKTSYTFYYHDTYVCPQCGETIHENITKSGGYYAQYEDGKVEDRRKEPREF